MKSGVGNSAAVVMVSFLLAGLAESQPQDQVFRARVARIEVDVRVTDDRGFVADLSADEFRVYEDEEPVEVLGVQLVDLAAGRPVEGSSSDRVGVEDRVGAGENAPVADRPPPTPDSPGAVIFLIDAESLSATTKLRFAEAWSRILTSTDEAHLRRAAYYVLAGRITELARLGADREALRAAAAEIAALPIINEARVDQLVELVADLPDPLAPQRDPFGGSRSLDIAARPAVAKARVFENEERRRALTSFRVLEAFCDALWVVEGRKTLVWVSSGVRLMSAGPSVAVLAAFEDAAQRSQSTPTAEVVPGIRQLRADLNSPDPEIAALRDQVFQAANDANVSIYALDPTPLIEARMPGADARLGGGGFRAGLSDPLVVGSLDALGDSLRQTAEATGGRAFVHATDLGAALQEAMAESSRYYLVTYAPPRAAPDGRHHRIRVEVDRPGVRVRARGGYVHLDDALREQRLSAAEQLLPGLAADAARLAAARDLQKRGEVEAGAAADSPPEAAGAATDPAAIAAAAVPDPPAVVAAEDVTVAESAAAAQPLPDPDPAAADRSPVPDEILAALARTARTYRDKALTFSCDETIIASLFDSSGNFRRRAVHELQYIYTFEELPADAPADAFRRLRDYRTRRDAEPEDGEVAEVRLDELDLPAVTVRAYSWAFLFQPGLQQHYRFGSAGRERVFDREALVISFEPVPPVVAGFNDWFGRAWVDAETHQVLRVEALQAGDFAELDAIERDRVRLEIPRDGRIVVRLEAEFRIEQDGVRLPSKVTLTGEDFSMRALNFDLPGNISSALPEWELRGREAFRVEQIYENYRFFNVTVR